MIRKTSVLLGLGLVLTAACSKENNVDQSQTSNNSYQQIIGQEGGLVGDPNGLSVFVQAGSLSQDTTISLTNMPAPGSFPTPPMGVMSPVYSFEPHGLTFAAPATVHLPKPPGMTMGTVYHAELGGAWSAINGADFSQPTVTFGTNAFSFFAVGQEESKSGADSGAPNADGGTTTDGGGGGPMDCATAAPVAGAPTGTTNGTGSLAHMAVPAGVQFNALDGYAVMGSSEMMGTFTTTYTTFLTLTFTDYSQACGYALGSGAQAMEMPMPQGGKQGSRVLGVGLKLTQDGSPPQIQPMTYDSMSQSGKPMVMFSGLDSMCMAESFPVMAMTSLTITSITATTVEGSITAMEGEDTFSGNFSFPICDLPTMTQGPGACCLL